MIILQRFFNRFPDSLQTCKMNHCGNLILFKDFSSFIKIKHIGFIKFYRLSGNLFYALHAFSFGITEIIHYYYVISVFKQLNAGMTSYKACTSGNQNFTHSFLLFQHSRAVLFLIYDICRLPAAFHFPV